MGTEINWGKDMTAEWEKSEAFNEIEWVEAVLGGEKTAVGVVNMGREGVDREWNDRIMEWLRRQIQELQRRGHRIILGGDFNGHIGNGEQGIKGNKEEINVNGRRVLELAKDKELEIVNRWEGSVGKWTRMEGQQETIIDYILISAGSMKEVESFRVDERGEADIGSDHNWVWMDIRGALTEKGKERVKGKWKINEQTDWAKFRQELGEAIRNMRERRVDRNIEAEGIELEKCLKRVAGRTIGKVYGRAAVRSIPAELREAIKERREGLKNYRRTKEDLGRYKRAKIKVNRMKIQEQKRKELKLITGMKKGNRREVKRFWRVYGKQRQGKNGEVVLEEGGREIVDKQEQANFVKEYWKALYAAHEVDEERVDENGEDKEEEGGGGLGEAIEKEEVRVAMKEMKKGKAVGEDDIPSEFLTEGGEEVLEWITEIFNKVLTEEKIPSAWKKGIVTALYKGGRKQELGNYRGITVNSSMYKLFTRILRRRLEEEVEERGILGEIQFGFRKGKNTYDAAFILRQIFDQGKRKKSTKVAFLDVRKAYDRVWREGLWRKMEGYGFGGKFLRVLKELYKEGTCRVNFGEIETDWFGVEEGLKQGCSLSPVLFALYLAELGERLVQSGLGVEIGDVVVPGLFFADDMVVMGQGEGDLRKLLKMVGEYGREWKMQFNSSKSKVVNIGKKSNKDKRWQVGEGQVQEGDDYCLEIKEQEEYKYLGIWFSGVNGIFKTHVKKTIKKAKKLKGVIKNVTADTYQRAGVVTKLWESLAIPSILYGVEVFDMADSDKRKLEIIERQVGRWAIGGNKGTGWEAIYGDLGWMSLESRIIEKKLIFAGRVASLEPENWTRQAWNMVERKSLPWANKIRALTEEVGLGGERVRIGQGTWKAEVQVAVDERDRLKWREGMENKSTLEKYRSKEEKSFEDWLDREEGRIVFNIRAGSLGLRNRTGRTAQDKTCQKCKEGEVENEQHVVLKCPAYRVERNRMLGKVRRIWGEERWGVWMGREEGEQLKEIVGLFGDPSEVLARTVGEGVRKMMKEREG